MILKLNKKGQMEVFGLAVIVILLVIGMLFMIRFVILAPQSKSSGVTSFINKDMASNIVVYMLSVNVDSEKVCNKNLDVTDLIRDCALGGVGIRCLGESEPLDTCDISKDVIETIFDNTLSTYGHQYYFRVYKSSSPESIVDSLEVGAKCRGTQVSGISFIPLTPDVLNLQLDVCT